jgi:hypothetical protein
MTWDNATNARSALRVSANANVCATLSPPMRLWIESQSPTCAVPGSAASPYGASSVCDRKPAIVSARERLQVERLELLGLAAIQSGELADAYVKRGSRPRARSNQLVHVLAVCRQQRVERRAVRDLR